MPPRKKRIVTVHSSSDRENGPSEPELKSAKERKPTSRKSVDPTDPDGPPPKKPRGRPRKGAVPDEDGDLSVQKPKRKPRKRPGEGEGEQDDLPDRPAKKQKNNTYEPTEGDLQEIYLTQLPQEDPSPPWKIRGPIWQKQKEQKPPPRPPVFYKPPAPPPAPIVRAEVASRPVPAHHSPQQPPQSPVQHVKAVKIPHQTPKDRQQRIGNPMPFYSSPFSPPKEPQNSSSRRSTPLGSPLSKANSKIPREVPCKHHQQEANSRLSSRPIVDKAGADMELDPADFSSSPPSLPKTTTNATHAERLLPNEADGRSSPVADENVPPVVPEDFSSSPPCASKTASDREEFDDDEFDDIDESLLQHLVSQGPSVNSKPSKVAPPTTNGGAQEVDPELVGLPSDAFSLSSMASPELQRAARAQREAILISSQEMRPPGVPQRLAASLNGLRQTTLFGGSSAPVPQSQVNKRQSWPAARKSEPPTHHKIDLEAMKTWVYPTNLGKIRDYQFNIVHRGLFHNLLVALPTGLGKTFIAATIMLNFLRWTTEAQIVFVAPTKPLVAQQVEACLGIAGIPRSQSTMLTGNVDTGLRAEEWMTKRVFFMTPQTMINDLKTGSCDAKKIVLLVVDEAHRATGAYAYVEIVKFIRRFNPSFRVLALTATPGPNVEMVQKVIDGLEISRVEIRMENSMDIQPFVHKREVEKKVLRDNKDLLVVKDLLSKAIQPVLDKLNQQNAYWSRDPLNISLYGLTQSRLNWSRSDAGRKAPGPLKGMVNAIFVTLTKFGRGMDLLKYHGIRPFYRILCDFKNDATTKYAQQITKNPNFEKLMNLLKEWTAKPDYLGHPKLEYLRQHVLNHFLDAGDGSGPQGGGASQTKVMVFAHWRDSAEDIVRVLKLNEPMIRPHVFVGQAATKTSEAMDQRRQEEVVKQFKAGVYNTLVATSIGEEGLDIGEVDLIVCYDQKASPIRMLQRMGRTGRKRQGNILLLQMEGKEENDALQAKDAYEKMQDKISKGDEFNFHTDIARRIVPIEINPVVEMKHIEIPIENSQPELPVPRAGKRGKTKRPPKKFQMPDGVVTGFVTAARMNGESDDEGQSRTKKRKKAPVIDEPEPMAAIDEVFLNAKQERELQTYYQRIDDADDDREIAPPVLKLHPEQQRQACRTRYVSTHSRLTTSFVDMVNRMHLMDKSNAQDLENRFKSNLHMSDLEAGMSADEVSDELAEDDEDEGFEYPAGITPKHSHRRVMDEVGEGASSSPPPTDPRMRFRSQAIDLGTQDTEGEDEFEDYQLDSELADFIADDADPVDTFSSSLPSIKATVRHTKLFTSSQKDQEDSDDDDLPDISQLVRRKNPEPPRKTASKAMISDSEDEDSEEEVEIDARKPAKRRLVIDDSESE